MKHIDLFSGIGGFALAATWVWGDEYENVGHSEIENYPCKVYHRHFPESECLGDITKIDWSRFAGTIDLVTGGFPCQPHSVAGKRKGEGDERDLWSECVRAIREIRPRFALFENVPGLFTSNGGRFFERVLSDISASGYDCEWQVLSAAEVGAWHKRERVWILSYPNERRVRRGRGKPKSESLHANSSVNRQTGLSGESCGTSEVFPDTSEVRLQRVRADDNPQGREESTERPAGLCGRASDISYTWVECNDWRTYRAGIWEREPGETLQDVRRRGREEVGLPIPESLLGRVAHGVSSRVDRLKGLGNAIVPQCAAVIMEKIKENM